MRIEPLAQRGYDVTSPDGFGALFDAAMPALYASLLRLTGGDRASVEDLIQDSFGELVRAIRDGVVTIIDVGWVVTVARRRYIDNLRRNLREERGLRLIVGARTMSESDEPDWQSVTGRRMLALLSKLLDHQRVALLLRYAEGLSVPEVAAELGRSIHATESLLARARRNLRALAEEDSDEG